jgi:hypothetical protein
MNDLEVAAQLFRMKLLFSYIFRQRMRQPMSALVAKLFSSLRHPWQKFDVTMAPTHDTESKLLLGNLQLCAPQQTDSSFGISCQ